MDQGISGRSASLSGTTFNLESPCIGTHEPDDWESMGRPGPKHYAHPGWESGQLVRKYPDFSAFSLDCFFSRPSTVLPLMPP